MKKKLFIPISIILILLLGACNPCADMACKNGATCLKGDCICTYGFESTLCDKVNISLLAGNYTASDACTDTFGGTAYTSNIVVRGTRLELTPVELFVNPVYANTDSADGKHIIILRQKPDGVDIIIQGDGQISFDGNKKPVLNLSYTVTDSTNTAAVTTVSCSPVFTHK